MYRNQAPSLPRRRVGNQQPTILISGFGPFPGMPFNASAALVSSLADLPETGGARSIFHAGLLPTAWQGGPDEAARLIRRVRPDAILHFGVASGATGFRIETRAANEADRAADCDGCLPGGHYVRRGGPPMLHATAPVDLIFRRLKQAGLPVSMSQHAGRYLCNAVLYNSLLLARSLPHRPLVGFVHIPSLPPDESADRRWTELRLGFSVILRTMSAFLRAESARSGAARPNRLRRALA